MRHGLATRRNVQCQPRPIANTLCCAPGFCDEAFLAPNETKRTRHRRHKEARRQPNGVNPSVPGYAVGVIEGIVIEFVQPTPPLVLVAPDPKLPPQTQRHSPPP